MSSKFNLKSIVYDIICFNCKKIKSMASDVQPKHMNHFLKIAESVGWKLIIDEEGERLLFACSNECANQIAERK